MELYDPSVERLEELKFYLGDHSYYGCHLTITNLILWSGFYKTKYTIIDDMLVFCKVKGDKPVTFSFPIGKADAKTAFDSIVAYYEAEGLPFSMFLVEKEMFAQIEAWYPGKYQYESVMDDADYLYESEKLATLSGKKLHGKRNHINRFIETYPDYQYETMDDGNWEECLKLLKDWNAAKQEDDEEDIDENIKAERAYEERIVQYAMEHRELLGMKGALLRVDGKVIAFTMGTPINKKVFDVQFEKAYATIQGAYAMMNREFVRNELLEYEFINREEDLGVPGLRKAKLSYYPVRMVEKGTVTLLP